VNILVTGGAGFIGSAVVRHLIEDLDQHVVCIDKLTYASNLESLQSVFHNPLFNFKQEDIGNFANILKIFKKFQPDKVLHLAAETHVDRSIDNPGVFIQSNIIGTYVLLQASLDYWRQLDFKRRSIFRFHHVSTDEVFGELEINDDPFNELTPYDPSSPYSASKASSDHLVRSWYRTYNLPIVLSNCSNNYGPFQFPEKLIPLIILKAIEGKPLPIYGNGDQIRDWLFIDDHVRALIEILKNGVIGESYNVGGNCEKSNLEVVTVICKILDELVPKHPRGVTKYNELISFVENRPGHDRRYAMDTSKINRDLDWEPKETFETGIQKTISWYLENKTWLTNNIDNQYQGDRLGLGVEK